MDATRCGTLLLIAMPYLASTAVLGEDRQPAPYGIQQRVPWTTSRIRGTPDPPSPYRTVLAFPHLKFDEPLAIVAAPGTDRLFVAERFGKIRSLANTPDVRDSHVLLNLEGRTIYGLAFHPDFATNGYFYVAYVMHPTEMTRLGSRVSRFQVQKDNPLEADVSSEKIIFQWPSGGHNGGCLKFGPDGFLYIATGDSGVMGDELLNGQNLATVSGAILRIDVDRPTDASPYSVPSDNPFLDVEEARPEIWAYGLRQPWKMSFDSKTGDLWTGNVGQDLWEQIYLIQRGGNYGWSVMEGGEPYRPERERGPGAILAPIVEHHHAEFRSITGGFVYRGTRLPDLQGAYIYGDYDTGKIWMFRYDRSQKKVDDHQELVDSPLRLVGFGQDHSGELYLLDHMQGLVFRLEENPDRGRTSSFPRKLSETGLFASVKQHRPADGVIPYDVIAPAWSDGAVAERFVALPGDSQIEFDGLTYPQPDPNVPPGWSFPDGAVLVQTLSLQLAPGKPRRIETRILHFEQLEGDQELADSFGAQYWRGYTYIWNDDQDEAVLLEDPLGAEETFVVHDPTAPGGKRQHTWHYPSRAECTVCHNMGAKYALGAITMQLNRDFDYGGIIDNQLRTFEHIGLFTEKLPQPPEQLPKMVDYADVTQDVNHRARSYLHVNCAHCHRMFGGGNSEFELLATIDLEEMKIVGAKPVHGGFFMPEAQIVAPGDPYRSVLFYRTAKLGPGRMPRLGSSVVDEKGLELLHDWIAQLQSGGPVDRSLKNLDAPSANNFTRLQGTTSDALEASYALGRTSPNSELRTQLLSQITQQPDHIRDLFERFLPESKRTKRLGSVIRPDAILALPGDPERGRRLFFETNGVLCKSCHKIHGQGNDVGPDLSQIGKKYDRAKILENILQPSKEIDPQYRPHLVQTRGGKVYTGLLVSNAPPRLVLKEATGKLITIPTDEIEQMGPQQQSIMPDLLLRDLTAEQVADLIAYLSSLKAAAPQ